MFKVPELPYAYDALEPHIDAQTLEIHHGKHHQGYCAKLNAAVEGTDAATMSLDEIIEKANSLPQGVKNNAGGLWNHSFYWTVMGPNGGEPAGEVLEAINSSFGSVEEFKDKFLNTAATVFGSGWAWLMKKPDGSLEIVTTANQDNPLNESTENSPVLVVDVWEHAYYIKYQNRRPEYLDAFWEAINWEKVNEIYNNGFTFSDL